MRISDWSSDVCSSDLSQLCCESAPDSCSLRRIFLHLAKLPLKIGRRNHVSQPIAVFTNDLHEVACALRRKERSEEHTSELQSLMRISYAVFCLKKKNTQDTQLQQHKHQTATTHNA